jgi:CBS domain-containing membrane protein
MEERISLGLDVDTVQVGSNRELVARVCVATAAGYTRDGGAPTLTSNCTTAAELELEVQRLKHELDGILAEARGELGSGRARKSAAAVPETSVGPTGEDGQHVATDLTVGAVMTRDVKTVGANDRLSLADELMNQGRFRHVVVLGEDGGVVGVVSRRDVFYGALAWSLGQGKSAHEKALETFPVKQVMNTEPMVVRPSMLLTEAAALMRERQIGCVPVVEDGGLVGILTEGDFLALLVTPPDTGDRPDRPAPA